MACVALEIRRGAGNVNWASGLAALSGDVQTRDQATQTPPVEASAEEGSPRPALRLPAYPPGFPSPPGVTLPGEGRNPSAQSSQGTPVRARGQLPASTEGLPPPPLGACALGHPSQAAPAAGGLRRTGGGEGRRRASSRPRAEPRAPSRTTGRAASLPASLARPPAALSSSPSLPPRRLSPPSPTRLCGGHYTSSRKLRAPATQLSRHQRH